MQNRNEIQVQEENSIDKEKLLDFYWKYFELHSNQRMQMINFYITVEIVLFGALFTLVSKKTRIPFAEWTASGGITFILIVFWGLDYRTKSLIHWCEDCMRKLEQRYIQKFGEDLLVISQSERKTEDGIRRCFTYSKWLGAQFVIVGIMGIVCLILLALGKL